MNITNDIYMLLLDIRKLEKAQFEELAAIRKALERLTGKQ